MKLSKFEYSEREGTERHWAIVDFCPGPVTLIVGRNATGKSRTLNAIGSFTKTLANGTLYDGAIHAEFDGGSTRYDLRRSRGVILHEELIVAGATLLKRDAEGQGRIHAADAHTELRFGLLPTQLAAVVKRDRIQHPFLEPLSQWGINARHYRFGESMGKTNLAVIREGSGPRPDPRDPSHVVGLFAHTLKRHPELAEAVCVDMNQIGYDIERVFIEEIPPDSFEPQLGEPLHALAVKERSLSCNTGQLEMSQGMFRALSLLSLIRIATVSGTTSLILLDDIGEGLDFDRATSLISLIVQHAQDANVQLIMSTNDRYVMNSVPLDAWAVIVREGGICRPLTKANSPAIFAEFEATGLANFDFLRMEFWKSDLELEKSP